MTTAKHVKLGTAIRKERERLGLKQVEFAAELGMDQAQLCHLEKATLKLFPNTARKLAVAFNRLCAAKGEGKPWTVSRLMGAEWDRAE